MDKDKMAEGDTLRVLPGGGGRGKQSVYVDENNGSRGRGAKKAKRIHKTSCIKECGIKQKWGCSYTCHWQGHGWAGGSFGADCAYASLGFLPGS